MISIVIPSFNRRDCLLKLIEDVYSQENTDFEVVVVDDCSGDGSAEAVMTKFPQVKLVVNDLNSGCCITRNRGILAATGEIIVGLDSDVTLADRNLLEKVEKAFELSPQTSGFAFRVFASDGCLDDAPRWWHSGPIEQFATSRFETDYFSGTAFAFRRDQLIAAGLFPEHIFQYFEEVEVSYRIMDNGGIVEYSPDLTVIHHPGARQGWSDHRFFHSPRSQILLAVGCYPVAKGLIYLSTRLVRSFLRALAARKVRVYMNGIKSGFLKAFCGGMHRKPLKSATWRRISAMRQSTNFFNTLKMRCL